ncbi:unnamed protein product [Mytilus coruscus]|uniref:Endonuclease/exonuclease/phosphatase domain-containing protein n=1 Tax=Mytilus coruscus TaxID=42192 RepID=A0A6J8AEU6_MYTCO|nr:unnamed protein product [Mytilus coruscus]
MFNPPPSKLVTQLPTSDSNNCIAVNQGASQQYLFNQLTRTQKKVPKNLKSIKGFVESDTKFNDAEDVSNTLSNDSKNSFAIREDITLKVADDISNTRSKDSKNSFAVREENVIEKTPISSIQDRHSTDLSVPCNLHQNLNIKGFNSNKNYLIELLDKHGIILLQEQWLFNYEKELLKQHHSDFITFSRHIDDDEPMSPIVRPRGHGGIATLYRKSMFSMSSQLPDRNNRIQAIKVSTVGNPTCLINVYLPSRDTDKGHDTDRASLDTLKEIILKYQENHSITLQFCKENQIELLVKNPTDHTYFQGEPTSQIDYILVKSIENDKILRELIQVKILSVGHNTSEHCPVSADLCIELRTNQKQYRENTSTKVNWEKVNKDNYALKVQEERKDRKYLNMKTPYGIDQATNQLLNGLNNALETCYPRRKSKFSRKKS